MTRINLVEPHQLTDKHLMAEYRELPRIFTAVLKLQEQGKTPADVDIPDHYVLGQGHIKFFYNKIGWLLYRYYKLHDELVYRGFSLDEDLYHSICGKSTLIKQSWRVYDERWKPYPEEIYLNMVRICKRSKLPSVLEEFNEPLVTA